MKNFQVSEKISCLGLGKCVEPSLSDGAENETLTVRKTQTQLRKSEGQVNSTMGKREDTKTPRPETNRPLDCQGLWAVKRF